QTMPRPNTSSSSASTPMAARSVSSPRLSTAPGEGIDRYHTTLFPWAQPGTLARTHGGRSTGDFTRHQPQRTDPHDPSAGSRLPAASSATTARPPPDPRAGVRDSALHERPHLSRLRLSRTGLAARDPLDAGPVPALARPPGPGGQRSGRAGHPGDHRL